MEKSWSVSLEHDEYEMDIELVMKAALEAVEKTEKGFYVNIVTPSSFGNPDDYLSVVLREYLGSRIEMKLLINAGMEEQLNDLSMLTHYQNCQVILNYYQDDDS